MIHFAILLFLVVSIAGSARLIYATGGTSFVYVHILYIPISLAAFCYGVSGGVIAGILAGLAVGPYMPLDVATGTAQDAANWINRAAFFALIGATAGLALTLLRRSLRAVVHASLHDPLTGLPNRRGLLQTLDDRLASGQRDDTRFSVLALDVVPLSRYSDVVSTLGHARADSFVVDIGHTIARTLPPTAGVHYLGGLRFVIDLSDAGPDDDREIRNRLLESLDRAVDRGEVPIYIEPYIGIARYPDHGRSSLELLRAAINALVDAMSGKRQQAIYDPERRRDREDRYAILRELTDALRGDPPFVLHYQPQISVQDRRVVGAEALLRWPHPTRTWIPPGQFIELAEQTRLMRPLTAWVIGRGLATLAEWQRRGRDLKLSVNVSIRDLERPAFPDELARMLEAFGIAPRGLTIEVTESALMENRAELAEQLARIRHLGVGVALDDFGTGQSSLAYLQQLPVDELKLDRSFVSRLNATAGDAVIVELALTLAGRLKMTSVAEGVEDEHTLARLAEWSCDLAQGYHVARPMPLDDFERWLAEWRPGIGSPPSPLSVSGSGAMHPSRN